MLNGDYIEGIFIGMWGDGIWINGIFYKLEVGGLVNKIIRFF